jgi:hypothetical protein
MRLAPVTSALIVFSGTLTNHLAQPKEKSMYKKLGLMTLGALFLTGSAIADEHGGGEALYQEQCANCHFEDDFSGESADAIAGMIKGIKAGDTKHNPKLSDLADEDIMKLAEYFASQ